MEICSNVFYVITVVEDSGELRMVYPVLGSCLAAGAGNPSTSKVSEVSWTSLSFGLVGSGLGFCSKQLMAIFSI